MEKSLLENGNDTIPTLQQTENRWKSMTHQFKKTGEHNNISGNNRKNCRYYEELNDICPPMYILACKFGTTEGYFST